MWLEFSGADFVIGMPDCAESILIAICNLGISKENIAKGSLEQVATF